MRARRRHEVEGPALPLGAGPAYPGGAPRPPQHAAAASAKKRAAAMAKIAQNLAAAESAAAASAVAAGPAGAKKLPTPKGRATAAAKVGAYTRPLFGST